MGTALAAGVLPVSHPRDCSLGAGRGTQPGRGRRAGTGPAVPAAWPLGLRVLQPALWALRFGFLLCSFPLPRQAPGLSTDLKGKSGLRGTVVGTGRGKHGAGAGQAVGDGGEVMP